VASSNSKFDKNLIGILWLFLLSTIKSYQSAAFLIFPHLYLFFSNGVMRLGCYQFFPISMAAAIF